MQSRLEEKLSPEQIAAELRLQFREQPEMWVSHEAIYQAIYVQGRGALRKELALCLRTGRALRKPTAMQETRTTMGTGHRRWSSGRSRWRRTSGSSTSL